LAELERFRTRRERRLRRLGLVLVVSVLLMAGLFVMSYKASIWDNNMGKPDWVTFENPDGDQLSGLVLSPDVIPAGGCPAVIVVHDLTGNKEQLNKLSFELVRHGFIVLAVDLRDHGRSDGKTTYGDYYSGEPHDIVAAYDYLVGEVEGVDGSSIAIVGDGFGGAMALMATNQLWEAGRNVTATVALGPPVDLDTIITDSRYEGYWDRIQVYLDRRAGEVNWDYPEHRENRSALEHMDAANWTSGSVYIIYGGEDDLVPTEQFESEELRAKAETNEMTSLDHELSESEEALKATIVFLESRLRPSSSHIEVAFNYGKVDLLNNLLNAMSVVVMVLAFLTLYEGVVLKKTARSYMPEISKNEGLLRLGVFTLFEIVVYAGVAFGGAALYRSGFNIFLTNEGGVDVPLLAGGSLLSLLLVIGLAFVAVGFAFWYVEARMFKKDDERTEESCGNIRGAILAVTSFVIILVNFLIGQLLVTGSDYPKDITYVVPSIIVFVYFLGHEIWMRKLLHPKINTMLSSLFIRRRWPYQLTFFAAMYGLYCALMLISFGTIGKELWGKDFWLVYGMLVSVVGLVATIIYHRSKSILASVVYSSIITPWLLNVLYHF
jgi:dienelactone hydrolase